MHLTMASVRAFEEEFTVVMLSDLEKNVCYSSSVSLYSTSVPLSSVSMQSIYMYSCVQRFQDNGVFDKKSFNFGTSKDNLLALI